MEQQWIQKCRKGDRQAQEYIYDLYCQRAFQAAVHLVRNVWDAEEVMHEAFLTAFRKLDRFDGRSSFYTWFYRILVRKCLDHLKWNKDEWVELNEEVLTVPDDPEPVLEKDAGRVLEAIGSLPQGYRTIATLYLLEGYDHEEIGEILDISPSTSRSQYTRARQKLRERLQYG